MRKKYTEEQKKEAYEKQKAKFREWYANPENRAKKMEANQAWKDAHRQYTRDYSRNKYYEYRNVTMVKASRATNTVTVWFISRAEMNKWLRANNFVAVSYHKVFTYEGSDAGLWLKAGREYYVSIWCENVRTECLLFSS